MAYAGFGAYSRVMIREKKCLAVLSISRYSAQLGEAFRKQAEIDIANGYEVNLSILLIHEEGELHNISRAMEDQAFLGNHIKSDVLVALREEHLRLMGLYVTQIQAIAEELGVKCTKVEGDGDFTECVLQHVREKSADVIFLVQDDRPFILRFLLGSQVDRAVQLITKEGKKPILVQRGS